MSAWHLGTRLQIREAFTLSPEGSRQRDGEVAVHDLALLASLSW